MNTVSNEILISNMAEVFDHLRDIKNETTNNRVAMACFIERSNSIILRKNDSDIENQGIDIENQGIDIENQGIDCKN
jgi:hypothetical protein